MKKPTMEQKEMAINTIINGFEEALDEWLKSDEHKSSCHAYTEDGGKLPCCLDHDEDGRLFVLAGIKLISLGFMDFADGLVEEHNNDL